ncbi:MAG: hypothetical protein IPJ61_21260 [Tessaracoccus sp.]|uniref:hypothetical protein n=1 Tax=Tessaracoccus sp. TaxID=1971211 RepID=UPI001EC5F83F|nr:hypothetical protein [Tessaracoccus sp.]MBK7823518.1 hypothetical protein [Tessaracoccus sp.]
MSPVELLPRPLGTDRVSGLFPINDGIGIPGDWGPVEYVPAALPTPFARAEALRLVLARDLSRTVEPPTGHAEMMARFDTLLIGIASGALTIENGDLRDDRRFDNFGRALVSVDPEARFFGILRWRESATTSRHFGITHHAALFAPHARRTKSEWDSLAKAIGARRGPALTLLAEWRAALARTKRWEPGLAGCEWQHGVDRLLAAENILAPVSELAHLRDDCQFVGPCWLGVPTGRPEEPVRREAIYLPRHEPGFAANFARLCALPPHDDNTRGQITFQAPDGRPAGWIAMPPGGTENNLVMLALGAGGVSFGAAPEVQPHADDWIIGKPDRPGLRDLLRPLIAALQARNPGRVVDVSHVTACPPLYPDPIRILVGLNRWPAPGQARPTRRLRAVLTLAGRPLPDSAAIVAAGGQVVELGEAKARVALYLVDALPGLPPVNDLRALGYALWQVFVGEVRLAGDRLMLADPVVGRAPPLGSDAESPLEPSSWVYDFVAGQPPVEIGRRLATLQRFVKASGDPVAGHPVLAAAASSFARWASTVGEVAALGRDARVRLPWRLPTGDELALPVDPVEQ